jgi:hypothetical protein
MLPLFAYWPSDTFRTWLGELYTVTDPTEQEARSPCEVPTAMPQIMQVNWYSSPHTYGSFECPSSTAPWAFRILLRVNCPSPRFRQIRSHRERNVHHGSFSLSPRHPRDMSTTHIGRQRLQGLSAVRPVQNCYIRPIPGIWHQ